MLAQVWMKYAAADGKLIPDRKDGGKRGMVVLHSHLVPLMKELEEPLGFRRADGSSPPDSVCQAKLADMDVRIAMGESIYDWVRLL